MASKWLLEIDKIKLLGGQGRTLQDIGAMYGISRERMRQIVKQYNIFSTRTQYGLSWIASERRKNPTLEDVKKLKFLHKKNNYYSMKEKVPWDLKYEDIFWPEYCPVLGIKLDYFTKTKSFNHPAFDRFIPCLGYVKGNVHIISSKANTLKSNGTTEEFAKIWAWMNKITCSKEQQKVK